LLANPKVFIFSICTSASFSNKSLDSSKNNSCALAGISSFEKIFYQMINDSEFRNKIIKNADKSIQKYISFPYEGATTLLTFLEKFENKL